MSVYPRYSIWFDDSRQSYEVVRWDDRQRFETIQTNIRTREKAEQARADWIKRAEREDHQ